MTTTTLPTTKRRLHGRLSDAAEPRGVEALASILKEENVLTESITLATVDGLPPEISADYIADAACNAAFKQIADMLAEHGYPVTGDFGPDEVAALDRVFLLFTRAMALNNPTLADPVRWVYPTDQPDEIVSVQVEAMAPDEIPADRGVTVKRTNTTGMMGEEVRLTGTRRDVARLLLDQWAAGPDGDVEWLVETMNAAETVTTG